MRIYRVVPDVNNYQGFALDYPDDHPYWKTDEDMFDGTPRGSAWSPPSVIILHPKLKRGHFLGLVPGVIALDAHATEVLQDLLEMSGELLPLTYKGDQFTVLNVTQCIDALDDANTKWIYGKTTGAKIHIAQYAFHKHRLTETPLFKIPETDKSEILTFEGMKDPDDEFKPRVERLKLTGLLFQEIWDSEK